MPDVERIVTAIRRAVTSTQHRAVVAAAVDRGRSAQPDSERPGSTPPTTVGASSRLLRAYLAIGAWICGPPAIDREFGTIDFLTLLDLHALPAIVRAHFLR